MVPGKAVAVSGLGGALSPCGPGGRGRDYRCSGRFGVGRGVKSRDDLTQRQCCVDALSDGSGEFFRPGQAIFCGSVSRQPLLNSRRAGLVEHGGQAIAHTSPCSGSAKLRPWRR